VSSSAKGDSMEANLRGYDAYKNENYIGAVDAYTQVTMNQTFFPHR
jgi:hypothetical protein